MIRPRTGWCFYHWVLACSRADYWMKKPAGWWCGERADCRASELKKKEEKEGGREGITRHVTNTGELLSDYHVTFDACTRSPGVNSCVVFFFYRQKRWKIGNRNFFKDFEIFWRNFFSNGTSDVITNKLLIYETSKVYISLISEVFAEYILNVRV